LPGNSGDLLGLPQDDRPRARRARQKNVTGASSTFRFSVLRWWQWPTMVLGAAPAWLLAVDILPVTWRRRDPHCPAELGSQVYL
jgi:hypothetical protein